MTLNSYIFFFNLAYGKRISSPSELCNIRFCLNARRNHHDDRSNSVLFHSFRHYTSAEEDTDHEDDRIWDLSVASHSRRHIYHCKSSKKVRCLFITSCYLTKLCIIHIQPLCNSISDTLSLLL